MKSMTFEEWFKNYGFDSTFQHDDAMLVWDEARYYTIRECIEMFDRLIKTSSGSEVLDIVDCVQELEILARKTKGNTPPPIEPG